MRLRLLLGRGFCLSGDEKWNSEGWPDKKRSACTSFRSSQKKTRDPSYHFVCDFSGLSGHSDGRSNPIHTSEAWKPRQTSYPAQTLSACISCTGQHSWSIDSDACANFREAESVWTITISYNTYSEHQFSESR